MNIITKNIISKVVFSEEEKELFQKTGEIMQSCCDCYPKCNGCPFQGLFYWANCEDVSYFLVNIVKGENEE